MKWCDNKNVKLLSTFSSALPENTCKRFDRKIKQTVEVPMPNMVAEYNKFMGGVDLQDQLLALYRITIRSKKYYHRIFFHFVDMAVVNSWLLYRRDCDALNVSKKNRLKLVAFKLDIATCLLSQNKPTGNTSRTGRPSLDSSSVDQRWQAKKKRCNRTKLIPSKLVRLDNVGHFSVDADRQRCKMPGCKSSPT